MFSFSSKAERNAELRQDPITGKWVIISPQRAERPQEFDTRPRRIRHGPCPFCPGNEELTPPATLIKPNVSASPQEPSWKVRVVPNKYPALVDSEDCAIESGIYRGRTGLGVHEVLIETPRHVQGISDLTAEEMLDVVEVLMSRLAALKSKEHLRYVMVFKNVGPLAGASVEHTHSQIIATPVIPPTIEAELAGTGEFFRGHQSCIYCQIVQYEIAKAVRTVQITPHFLAMCPFAARFPYETWILPRQHNARFSDLERGLWGELIQITKDLIQRIEQTIPGVGYNVILHDAPLHDDVPFYHWHIEILPSTARPAGFEWGSGVHINSVFPEFAARSLREGQAS
ncbi:MAG: galactose-1-phosphate uridylyltransferase [Thermogutta sp.]|nr:galactose-1-phosphate uridylyltransferase [Thermogutta sp.]HPU07801.1 galactose-1-phosphate uridylyltransferase [Thermogutta sp.]